MQIELRDEWELNEDERKNIYNSQHEVINEMIRIEEEEALNEEENYEQEEIGIGNTLLEVSTKAAAKAPVIPANAETTKFKVSFIFII